jgi:hypothetical protein
MVLVPAVRAGALALPHPEKTTPNRGAGARFFYVLLLPTPGDVVDRLL